MNEVYEKDDIKTTTINEYELLKHRAVLRRSVAERFLSGVTVYPFDRASAKRAAALYVRLKEEGKMVNESDLLIAGIALSNDDVLLTRDKKFSHLGEASIRVV